jgi:hypothetical protein
MAARLLYSTAFEMAVLFDVPCFRAQYVAECIFISMTRALYTLGGLCASPGGSLSDMHAELSTIRRMEFLAKDPARYGWHPPTEWLLKNLKLKDGVTKEMIREHDPCFLVHREVKNFWYINVADGKSITLISVDGTPRNGFEIGTSLDASHAPYSTVRFHSVLTSFLFLQMRKKSADAHTTTLVFRLVGSLAQT